MANPIHAQSARELKIAFNLLACTMGWTLRAENTWHTHSSRVVVWLPTRDLSRSNVAAWERIYQDVSTPGSAIDLSQMVRELRDGGFV